MQGNRSVVCKQREDNPRAQLSTDNELWREADEMNGIANRTAPIGIAVSVIPGVSVSRGVLAMQGTGRAVTSVFGAELQAPQREIKTDELERSWQPAFTDAGAHAADTAPMAVYLLQAHHLRQAHPATVIRSRHRSRLR
jgi:hypothetical protein